MGRNADTRMTRAEWQRLLGCWCEILELSGRNITIGVVPASKIPGCDADVVWTDRDARDWHIQVRSGKHDDGELTLVHELLHIRTGHMDPRDEANLWAIARALVGLKRA